MDQFPSNSKKSRVPDEAKNIEKITSAETRSPRKRGLGRQFKDAFVNGNPRDTMDSVVLDVIIPGTRDILFDAFEAGLQRMIYGESSRRRRGGIIPTGYGNQPPRIDYGSLSRGPVGSRSSPSQDRTLSRRSRERQEFDELIIPSRQEAEEVIDQMFEILSRYGTVSVADLYALTGVRSSHTDMKWGWSDLRGTKPIRLRNGGFLLDLPEPEPLG